MSKLEELIQQYCPDGVEYKTLGAFSEQFSGMTGVSNKWAESGNCQFIDYMNVYKHLSVDTSALKYATVKNLNQNTLMTGDILFTSASETPDECALSAVIEDEIQEGVFLDDHLFGLRIVDEHKTEISPSYLKYAFHSDWFRTQVRKVVRGVTRNYVSKVDFMKLEIPIPPLPVQEEIVRILDNFTELQAELQAELQKRLQQYNYYRDNLLSFEGRTDVEWKKLGEVCDFRNGFAFKSDLFKAEGFPIVRITNITGQGIDMQDVKFFHMEDYPKAKMSPFEIEDGDILVAMSGATTGKIGVYKGRTTAYLNQRTGKFVPHKGLNNRFLYHFLLTQVSEMYRMAGGGAQPNLSSNDLKAKISIPIPSLPVQEKIADILDRFDSLTNDLTAGLPAEIEKRKQQYEYYRDKLLTFKRKEA